MLAIYRSDHVGRNHGGFTGEFCTQNSHQTLFNFQEDVNYQYAPLDYSLYPKLLELCCNKSLCPKEKTNFSIDQIESYF
jgi:ATP sulfurylase